MQYYNTVKVLLPARIFEQAGDDKRELRRLILSYMERYPDYTILKVKDGFAVCDMGR